MRIVLDTNVLLAGFATYGLCQALLAVCFREHEVVRCDHILDELAEHIRRKFKATPQQVQFVVSVLRANSELVVPAPVPAADFADRDDRPVLGAAVAGCAQCIVTGDRKLIALASYQSVSNLPPRAFYEVIRG